MEAIGLLLYLTIGNFSFLFLQLTLLMLLELNVISNLKKAVNTSET